MFSFFGKYKQWGFNIVLGIFLFFTVFSAMFPERAYAQGQPTYDNAAFIQREKLHGQTKIETTIWQRLAMAGMSATIQSLSYFASEFAYRTAVYIASSDKGRKSLLHKESWGDFFENTALNAAAVAIQDFGQSWGFDICQFPNLNLQMYLELGLRQMERPQINCTWQDLKNTFNQYSQLASDTADFLNGKNPAAVDRAIAKKFLGSLRLNNTDFGVAAGAIVQVDNMKVQKEKAAYAERTTNKGFKDLGSIISGNVMTPGEVIGQETKAQLSGQEKMKMSWGQIGSIYGSGAFEILPSTAAMFINTLINTYVGRFYPSNPEESLSADPELAYDSNSSGSSYAFDQLQAAKTAFSSFKAVPPQGQVTDFDTLLLEMSSCPESPSSNNCVMDSGLQSAFSISDNLTIREALDKGYLHGDWKLISPRRSSEHEDIEGCMTNKYCYSNIQKMRKARMLPLGFEIAALRSDPDHPWSLKDVVDGFDKCDYAIPGVATSTQANPAFPYCHLINPNWILKLPKYHCDAMVYSDNLAYEGSAERKYECADLSSCISFNADGSCAGWGYCTKEKSTWDIKVDKCEAQYNTCTTFVNNENNQITSYLAKTVDYGKCTADNTGCRAYSLSAIVDPRTATTTWKTSIQNSEASAVGQKQYGDIKTAYFNAKIKNLSTMCNANNDGCTAFWQAQILDDGRYVDTYDATIYTEYGIDRSAPFAYLKKAPDYLGCYDRDLTTPEIEWPRTIPEANEAIARNNSCNNFASACVASEVGCEAFTPLSGGASIPGKIGSKNFCASECVGYETFKQEASEFDPGQFPLYFIASQADKCSAEAVGCTEFTNIDALSRGGESLEYYTHIEYCEKPNNDSANPNVRTFYSWEGSANTGYNIITHKLRPLTQIEANTISSENEPDIAGMTAGSPAYVLTTPEALREYTGKCNQVSYNILLSGGPDALGAASTNCKALFDDAGNTYYRLTDYTIVIDDSCHPLRKTESVFERETRMGYNNREACEAIHDRWNTSVAGAPFCERCINGGKYENGACVYHTISRPDVSNSCKKEENGCRAYTGNTVGNIEDVIALEDFEPFSETESDYARTLGAWRKQNSAGNNIRIVKEAVLNEKHSLQVDSGVTVVRDMATSTFQKDMWYELSFVAKSAVATTSLQIHIKQGAANTVVGTFASEAKAVVLQPGWNVYTFGPIQFTGSSDLPSKLVFERTGENNKAYFIDQVRVRRLLQSENYIKDSWKNKNGGLNVPNSCDSIPEDQLPGEALGCEAYKDSNDITRYAVGFESLCREKAIACQPLWDTHNTLEGEGAERAQAFNVLCFGAANQTCKVMYQEQELGNCFIPQGETSCHVTKIVLPVDMNWAQFATAMNPANAPAKVALDASSIVTLADTPESTPIFLALGEKQKYACDKGAVACQRSGLEAKYLPSEADTSFQFTEFFVKNDPDKYSETLCRNDLVGCSKYLDAGKETFFKDPVITGGSLCKWKSPGENENRTYGWFLDGVGKCEVGPSNNRTLSNALCKVASDCSGIDPKCISQDTVACAPDHLVGDGMYDIWSNQSPAYRGNVGICPAAANQCREIIDRQETSPSNPEGKPYYLIFNEKVAKKRDGSECPNNQVSLTEGCVLFDKTDEPNKLYDSAATYARSEKKANEPYGLVPPVTSNDTNFGFRQADSNLVLKVDRSRECSQWLSCESESLVKNPQTGEYRYVCDKLTACEKVGANPTECAKAVDPLEEDPDGHSLNAELAMNRLTYNQYVSRKTSWFDEEFSGYSLYNRFQIGDLIYVYFKFPKEIEDKITATDIFSHSYIARSVTSKLFSAYDGLDKDCVDPAKSSTDWQICGFDDGGRCYSGYCLYPVNGLFGETDIVNSSYITADPKNLSEAQRKEMADQVTAIITKLDADECKSAPEPDSPFSNSILQSTDPMLEVENVGTRQIKTDKKSGFELAHFCQYGDCVCSYNKIEYNNGIVDYWPLEPKAGYVVSNGICAGGPKSGSPCDPNTLGFCDSDKTSFECAVQTKVDPFIGYTGYCLEYDLGRPNKYNGEYPCLTWLPVQGSVSPIDLYNAEQNAGYNPSVDGKVDENDPVIGGVAYCVAATVGKIELDQEVVDSAFDSAVLGEDENWATHTFPPFDFQKCMKVRDNDGGDIRSGGFDFRSVFHHMFCESSYSWLSINSIGISEKTDFIQNWAASSEPGGLGDFTAKVWRVEANHNQTDYNGNINFTAAGDYSSIGPYLRINDGAAEEEGRVKNCGNQNLLPCQIYGLTPRFDQFVDLGVMVHPPRLFDYTSDQIFGFKCASEVGLQTCPDFGSAAGGITVSETQWYAVSCDRNAANESRTVQIPGGRSCNEEGICLDLEARQEVQRDPKYDQFDTCLERYQNAPQFEYMSTGNKIISPVPYSSEFDTNQYPSYSLYDNVNGFLINKDLESSAKLDYLKRVYFLPTGYPGGAEGPLPSLMNKNMYLDFAELDKLYDENIRVKTDVIAVTDVDNHNEGEINDDLFFAAESGQGKLYKYVLVDTDIQNTPQANESSALKSENLPEELQIKNRIFKRYVLYFKTQEEETSRNNQASVTFDPRTNVMDFPGQDPFNPNAVCSNGGDQGFTWFAIGMDFNREGDFLGYITRFCMGYDPDLGNGWQDYGIQYAVVATYNEMCTDVSKVYDTKRQNFSWMRKDSNKAWTNRVWQYGNKFPPAGSGIPDYSDILRDMEEMPFGSLGLSDKNLDIQQSYINTFMYPFRNVVPNKGIPLSCKDGDCTNLEKPTSRADDLKYTTIHDLQGKNKTHAYSFMHQLFAKEYLRVGISNSLERPELCMARITRQNPDFHQFVENVEIQQGRCGAAQGGDGDEWLTNISDEIHYYGIDCDGRVTPNEQLIIDSYTDCVNNTEENIIDAPIQGFDFATFRTSTLTNGDVIKLMPPQIYSLQPHVCLVERNKTCLAWEKDSFTIGDKNGTLGDYNGDALDDEDINGDGIVDPFIVFGNIYKAKMRFFAFADDERMPIRRLKIDWGDHSASDQLDKRGLYKNRKPVCERDNGNSAAIANVPLVSVCMATTTISGIQQSYPTGIPCINPADSGESLSPVACPINQYCLPRANLVDLGPEYSDYKRFGNLERACETQYFEFGHQYTCSSEDVDRYRQSGTESVDAGIVKVTNSILSPDQTAALRAFGVDYVCVFKPKLQVMDNWGWCNGTCTKKYNNQGNPVGGDTPAEQVGCYNAWPTDRHDQTVDQCDYPMGENSNINPWTEYKQYIIMVPSKE